MEQIEAAKKDLIRVRVRVGLALKSGVDQGRRRSKPVNKEPEGIAPNPDSTQSEPYPYFKDLEKSVRIASDLAGDLEVTLTLTYIGYISVVYISVVYPCISVVNRLYIGCVSVVYRLCIRVYRL